MSRATASAANDLPKTAAALQHALLVGREQIDPRGDSRLDGLGESNGVPGAERTRELFREERITADPIHESSREQPISGERHKQALGLDVRERWQPDDATPARPTVEQLRPSRADHEHRAASPIQETVQEVEQAVVRPMKVFDDENSSVASALFEEAPPSREQLAPLAARVRFETDEQSEVASNPLGLGQLIRDDGIKLRRRDSRRIVIHDPSARLHHLREREVGRTTVRETTPRQPRRNSAGGRDL